MAEASPPAPLHAVLLGLDKDLLLLPRLGIVEFISCEGLLPRAGSPAWFAGMLAWQDMELPVIRIEHLNAPPAEAPAPDRADRRCMRAAVISGIGRLLSGGHFGVLYESNPQLVTLDRAALRYAEARPQDRAECVLSRVYLAGTEAAIPNLEGIERQLAAVLNECPVGPGVDPGSGPAIQPR